ncbi:hypothetical protein [Microvirga rosea]|uniref:hypothetical protein n=1 Tax=Microvirga rosea TaxID=2715425 RepID=UPI001D0B278A|nr:hypothetical protein [Microvirga rosea]MCB8823205.1 hypothetical protein [Microvirga rosea]
MGEAHPAIAVYGKTLEKDFDLVLVVGREPNSDNPGFSTGIDTYDFDHGKGPRCAFWNSSYGIAGQTIGLTTRELKVLCRQQECSPIAYADALPITLPNSVKNKFRARLAIADEDIERHLTHLFSHQEFMRRVGLVLLSGIETPEFQRSFRLFDALCQKHGKMVRNVPFFFGNNVPKIKQALDEEAIAALTLIMKKFRRAGRFSWDGGSLVPASVSN